MGQLLQLRKLGCHEIQGFLISPPVAAADFGKVAQLAAEPAFSPAGAELQLSLSGVRGESAPGTGRAIAGCAISRRA